MEDPAGQFLESSKVQVPVPVRVPAGFSILPGLDRPLEGVEEVDLTAGQGSLDHRLGQESVEDVICRSQRRIRRRRVVTRLDAVAPGDGIEKWNREMDAINTAREDTEPRIHKDKEPKIPDEGRSALDDRTLDSGAEGSSSTRRGSAVLRRGRERGGTAGREQASGGNHHRSREKGRRVFRVCSETSGCFKAWICVPDERIADIAIISTMENLRLGIVHAFAERGYAIILEKPMAQTYTECSKIVKLCTDNNIVWAVAHTLRYDPHVVKILDIIEKGVLGEVVSIHHTNPIGWFHFAHSHVRGKWSQVNNSSTLFVNKCCHDVEFIRALQPSVEVRSIYSVGSLMHFKEENKPPAAGGICIGCAAEDFCPYSASRIYLQRVKEGYRDWPITDVTDFPDNDTVTEALIKGPFGKCVYEQMNDSVDNQVVLMVFDSGTTATITCNAFTEKVSVRRIVIRGSKGELTCDFDESFIKVYDFIRRDFVVFYLNDEMHMSSTSLVSSRDADRAFIESFISAVKAKSNSGLHTSGKEVLKTYLILFAADRSRMQNRMVNPNNDESLMD